MDRNDGYVSSTWETEEDVDQDILTMTEYTQACDLKDTRMPLTLVYHYSKQKKKLELEGLSEKEANCTTLEKDVDENLPMGRDEFSENRTENKFDCDMSVIRRPTKYTWAPRTRLTEAQGTEPSTLQHVNDAEKTPTTETRGQTFHWSPGTRSGEAQVTQTASVRPTKDAEVPHDFTVNVNREQDKLCVTSGEPQKTKRVFRKNCYSQGNPTKLCRLE